VDIGEAVKRLKEIGLEARIMGEGLLGGKEIEVHTDNLNQTLLKDYFGVYQEGTNWIVNMSGVGQLPLIIKRSSRLDESIEAACGFFALKSQCSDNSMSIQMAIWSLQRLGLVAEIEANSDIRIRCSKLQQVDYTYDFMVNLTEEDLANTPCEFVLHWMRAENQWHITATKTGRVSQNYQTSTLEEAVQLLKGLR
jgi:hypothetical protein